MKKIHGARTIALLTTTAAFAFAFPAFGQTANPQTAAPGAAPSQTTAEEEREIVVTGIRESLASSAAIKRNANEVVDSITAEDIGKLPDPNVAETLTRIPGVQGYRYGGESASPVGNGSGITIRGLSGQTASQVDGRQYFTAGGREFNIESAIPGMVAGIDVYKNPSAEHIEGGIGGLVNIRTRKPFDFKGLTVSGAVTARYNDLTKKLQPDAFLLISDRWNVGDGEMGLVLSANYQQSFNRSDATVTTRGNNFKRVIRADSPEYASRTALNRAYVGRSDVYYLDPVTDPLTLTAAQRADVISTTGLQGTVQNEDIRRVRKGLNGAFQYKPTPDLEFYVQGNYNYYLYNQDYRFLQPTDSAYVTNLVTTPFTIDETIANRNSNGGANETLSSALATKGTFLGSTFSSNGGNEHRTYTTWIAAAGVNWNVTDRLHANFDFAYVKADQTQDNRSATLVPRAGATWDITRDGSTFPPQISIAGPDLASPNTWVFSQYANGNNNVWHDDGYSARVDLTYTLDGFLRAVKVGARYATQRDNFSNYAFSGRNLTTDGLALTATRTNGISAGSASYQDLVTNAPSDILRGALGYGGGFVVFDSSKLLGDNVRARFPLANILPEDSLLENILQRRYLQEETYAGYVVGEYKGFNDRIRGNFGVRVVKTDLFARALVNDTSQTPTAIVPRSFNETYTDVLPTFNLVGKITPQLQVRFGYGKGLTRADVGNLNPTITVNPATGSGSQGNPELKPQRADSFDLSFENYFSPSSYIALGLFYKKINGFFAQEENCLTVPTAGAPISTVVNNCPIGQYRVSRTINSEKGNARGIELQAQTFFDFLPGALRHFGASGSVTYIDTDNPVTLNGVRIEGPQPFQSRWSYTAAGYYEDEVLSARLIYTYRSSYIFSGIQLSPLNGRIVDGYGLTDASVNIKLAKAFSISLNASNIFDVSPNRSVGELRTYEFGIPNQIFENGRIFSIGARFRFGG